MRTGIVEVARLAGVSKSTASRALTHSGYVSDATRARVRDAAASIGYVASTSAVSLATGRTQNVGVILPYVTRWFFSEVLEGVQDALLEHDLDLTLYNSRPGTAERQRIFGDFLARKRFDGLIAVGLEPGADELRQLVAIDRPIVSVVGTGDEISVIEIDDDHAARRATEHLIALGHRRIAFIGGGPHYWARVDRRRLQGYLDSMAEAGLDAWINHVHSAVTMPGGYAAAVGMLDDARVRPTGVVAVCDEVAIGTMIAARRLGIRVPADVSVVGIDDHEHAEMFGLTTLAQTPRQQGGAAVRLLLEQMDDPGIAPRAVRLHAPMIMRTSTAPPPGAGSATMLDSVIGRVAEGS